MKSNETSKRIHKIKKIKLRYKINIDFSKKNYIYKHRLVLKKTLDLRDKSLAFFRLIFHQINQTVARKRALFIWHQIVIIHIDFFDKFPSIFLAEIDSLLIAGDHKSPFRLGNSWMEISSSEYQVACDS